MNTQNTKADALQMTELVLKTARFEEMRDWYTRVLVRRPFVERTPDTDAASRPPRMPERPADLRLAFLLVHDFASLEEKLSFTSTAAFTTAGSWIQLDPAEFAVRFRSGEPLEQLLNVENSRDEPSRQHR